MELRLGVDGMSFRKWENSGKDNIYDSVGTVVRAWDCICDTLANWATEMTLQALKQSYSDRDRRDEYVLHFTLYFAVTCGGDIL
jgi:hypothetical protein